MLKAICLVEITIGAILIVGCGSTNRKAARAPSAPNPSDGSTDTESRVNYQQLLNSLGDRCYPGDAFSAQSVRGKFPGAISSRTDWERETLARSGAIEASAYTAKDWLFQRAAFQHNARPAKKRAVSSVEDLSKLRDIEMARFKDGELTLIGPAAREGEGLRPDDWYVLFRAVAGTEAPGVTIDPGPDSRLMQVRYFGGIQQTEVGNTFFEADRTLKLMSTGFDNATCTVWSSRPKGLPTELDLISSEIGDGSNREGQGGWHRFWFEPSENPIETEGFTMRIPKDRLVVRDESIPPGSLSPRSATEFARSMSANFLKLSDSIPAFLDLQRDAALVMLAKWMRDKQIPVDQSWLKGSPAPASTASTTPGITVMRAKLLDQVYLRYGIHGGVDFQKDNLYSSNPTRLRLLSAAADVSGGTDSPSWVFNFQREPYRAVRLAIANPVPLGARWIIWQRVVTRILAQPRLYRMTIPTASFEVTNTTGDAVTIEITGPISKTQTVSGSLPETIKVIPGFYHLTILSHCGTKSDAVSVAAGDRHQLHYYCESQRVNAPITSGIGVFVVNNNTGAQLTVTVGGLSYNVAPGTYTIRLSPGNYTTTITTRCGTATGILNITNGSTFNGQYSCN